MDRRRERVVGPAEKKRRPWQPHMLPTMVEPAGARYQRGVYV